MFQLTEKEFNVWRSQIVTSKGDRKGLRRPPFVFTEQGVAMLSTVLKSNVAIETSIKIMNAFIKLRKYFSNNVIENQVLINSKRIDKLEEDLINNSKSIDFIRDSLKKFEEKKIVNEIYFNGQIYDAYSKILDIFKEAKKEIIVIDGYADKSLLDITRELDTQIIVKLITFSKNTSFKTLYAKYQKQYSNLKVAYNDTFHDRYFILDQDKVYHCGTSINYAGSKTFSINVIEDEIIKKTLIKHVNTII